MSSRGWKVFQSDKSGLQAMTGRVANTSTTLLERA